MLIHVNQVFQIQLNKLKVNVKKKLTLIFLFQIREESEVKEHETHCSKWCMYPQFSFLNKPLLALTLQKWDFYK